MAAIVAPIVAVVTVFVLLVILIYVWFRRRERAIRAKLEARGEDGSASSASLLPTSNSVDAEPLVGILVVDAEVPVEGALNVRPKPQVHSASTSAAIGSLQLSEDDDDMHQNHSMSDLQPPPYS